jgi:hypothetical protein
MACKPLFPVTHRISKGPSTVEIRHTEQHLSEELANSRAQLRDQIIWNTSKPVIAAYLAREVAQKVDKSERAGRQKNQF